MAIGTPALIGNNGTGAATSLVITTSAAAPAGSQIVVFGRHQESSSAHSCTDSAGNTYVIDLTKADHSVGNVESVIYRASNVLELASGGTITISWTGSTTCKAFACHTTGLAATLPLTGTGIITDNAITTLSSGDITTTDANAVLFGYLGNETSNPDPGTFTEDANFTNLYSEAGEDLYVAYRIVSATETIDYSPTITNIVNTHVGVLAYKAASTAIPVLMHSYRSRRV